MNEAKKHETRGNTTDPVTICLWLVERKARGFHGPFKDQPQGQITQYSFDSPKQSAIASVLSQFALPALYKTGAILFKLTDLILKSNATHSFSFSCASSNFLVFTLTSHWKPVIFSFVLIGRCAHLLKANRKVICQLLFAWTTHQMQKPHIYSLPWPSLKVGHTLGTNHRFSVSV